MKTYLIFISFFIGIVSMNSNAQTTAIPDTQFEQILINEGIDSDGTINGQVLTSDIVGVLNLNLQHVQDLTGLQDFAALEILILDEGGVGFGADLTVDLTANTNLKKVEIESFEGLSTLDLTGLTSLEELWVMETYDDVITMGIDSLDLSTNTNINYIKLGALIYMQDVNLQNGNNANMFNFEMQALGYVNPNWPLCIKVDNAADAAANNFPYSNWTIDQEIAPTFYDTGVCTLSINNVKAAEVALFPNPVTDFLNIQEVQPQKIEVYNLQGKKIKSLSADLRRIDMRGLTPGMYFVKLYGSKRVYVEKIVKK